MWLEKANKELTKHTDLTDAHTGVALAINIAKMIKMIDIQKVSADALADAYAVHYNFLPPGSPEIKAFVLPEGHLEIYKRAEEILSDRYLIINGIENNTMRELVENMLAFLQPDSNLAGRTGARPVQWPGGPLKGSPGDVTSGGVAGLGGEPGVTKGDMVTYFTAVMSLITAAPRPGGKISEMLKEMGSGDAAAEQNRILNAIAEDNTLAKCVEEISKYHCVHKDVMGGIMLQVDALLGLTHFLAVKLEDHPNGIHNTVTVEQVLEDQYAHTMALPEPHMKSPIWLLWAVAAKQSLGSFVK